MNVFQTVSETILAKLSEGIVPWRKPWVAGLPCSVGSRKEYRGINIILLGLRDHTSRYWVTYKEAVRLQGHVKKGASLSMGRLQRVVSLLKHLRSLTGAELKGVKPVSYDRPGEMKTALAIRQRAHKLIEKAQGRPLKELAGLGPRTRLGRRDGSGKVSASASFREALARREVRLHIRNLERRLLNFLQSRSELYKRLTTELTLGDLERLISIVGGARAVRGLKRKLKSGELGAVQEADVSNTFVSQLEAAASQGGSGADSGGGSEDGGADSEVSTGAGEEIESETVVVAEGATPNATLTTAIVKTESPPGEGAKE